MRYYSKEEIENAIKDNEVIVINDEIVDRMRAGELDSYILREGLCGRDVRNFDFSGLSEGYLAYLSFDTNTIFPEHLQGRATELLENAKSIMSEISTLHSRGIDGTGRKITIIDTPFEITDEDEGIDYYSMDGAEEENHGITVLSIVRTIVPNAQVVFIGDDKKAGSNRKNNLSSFVRQSVGTEKISDSDIVSISSSISLDRESLDESCEILNSNRFYVSNKDNLGFRYGLVIRNGEEEIIEPADCISEGKDRRVVERFCLQKLEELGLDYPSISAGNIGDIISKLKGFGISEDDPRLEFISQLATSDEEYRMASINADKKVTPGIECGEDLVCIPSAGITVRQNGGTYKYIATNSNSFSIPVVSALFIMARQLDSTISLDEFSKICKETSLEKNGIRIISPVNAMEAIRGRNRIEDFEQEI